MGSASNGSAGFPCQITVSGSSAGKEERGRLQDAGPNPAAPV
jgi:hypothetical protein